MQDIIWIGLGVALVAAALIYVRLCDGA